MSGFMRVKMNGFDFDSHDPVHGIVRDEKRDEIINKLITSTIEYVVAIDFVLFAAWVCKWWLNGGLYWMYWAFNKLSPGFITMIEHGQI